jgi:cell division protein FtsQ
VVSQVKKIVHKTRRNRLKKDVARQRRLWRTRLWAGLKLTALMTALLAASALFMVVYAAVTSADYFRTQTIEVIGNQRLSAQTILEQSGIRRGDNLLALNLRLVRERLLDHAWIEAARVTRDIPETITIRVQEHVPLARIDLGRQFLINGRGRIFKEVESGDPGDLPRVSGIVYADISLGGEDLGPAMRAVVQVLRISQAQQGGLSYGDIARLHLDREMGVTLTLKHPERIVRMGFGDYEAKFERFKGLTAHLARNAEWRDFIAVDMNNPERVVVQLGAPL